MTLTALPPLALYIHFPWCEKKCPYCDFNSHQVKDGVQGFDEERYIKALITDLETELPRIWGRQVHSIFIGGGTPSLLSPTGMNDLLSAIRARVNLEPGAEITKHVQRTIWDLQPVGVNDWQVAPMNIHDEIMCVTRLDMVSSVTQVVRDSVEHFRPYVPLIGMDWNEEMANWAEKKSGTIKIRALEMMK